LPIGLSEERLKGCLKEQGEILAIEYDEEHRTCFVKYENRIEARNCMTFFKRNGFDEHIVGVKWVDFHRVTSSVIIRFSRELSSRMKTEFNETKVKEAFLKFGDVERVELYRQEYGDFTGIGAVFFPSTQTGINVSLFFHFLFSFSFSQSFVLLILFCSLHFILFYFLSLLLSQQRVLCIVSLYLFAIYLCWLAPILLLLVQMNIVNKDN
jgi:hypothetical protein